MKGWAQPSQSIMLTASPSPEASISRVSTDWLFPQITLQSSCIAVMRTRSVISPATRPQARR